MCYLQLISAIPGKWKKLLKTANLDLSNLSDVHLCESIQMQKPTKFIYTQLNKQPNLLQPIFNLWVQMQYSYDEFVKIARIRIAQNGKYDSFHYRLINRGILLNNRLYYYRIVDSQLCSQCQIHKEELIHFFCECNYS